MKELTETDKRVLRELPDGWFEVDDVPFDIRRPRYRLARLIERDRIENELLPGTSIDALLKGKVHRLYKYRKIDK